MIDMKKKAEDILEDYANFYSRADLEALAKFLEQIKSEAYKEFAEKHREMIMASRDDDDQISLKVCEYDANTDNLLKELTEGGNEDGMD